MFLSPLKSPRENLYQRKTVRPKMSKLIDIGIIGLAITTTQAQPSLKGTSTELESFTTNFSSFSDKNTSAPSVSTSSLLEPNKLCCTAESLIPVRTWQGLPYEYPIRCGTAQPAVRKDCWELQEHHIGRDHSRPRVIEVDLAKAATACECQGKFCWNNFIACSKF